VDNFRPRLGREGNWQADVHTHQMNYEPDFQDSRCMTNKFSARPATEAQGNREKRKQLFFNRLP